MIGHSVMSKTIFSPQTVKTQATRLAQYLTSRGVKVSRQQAIEGVCRAVYGRPWNVVKEVAVPPASAPEGAAASPELKAVYFSFKTHADSARRVPLAVLAQRWHEASGCSETVSLNVMLHQLSDTAVLELIYNQEDAALKLPGRRTAAPQEAEGGLMHTSCEATDTFAQWLAAFRPHLLLDYLSYRWIGSTKDVFFEATGLGVYERDGGWFVQIPEDTRSRRRLALPHFCAIKRASRIEAEKALCYAVLSGLESDNLARSIKEDGATAGIVFGSGLSEECFASAAIAGRKDLVTGAPLVLIAGAPALTYQELKHITEDGKYYLDVVLLMSISHLMEGIESADDRVAERITGSVADLQDISFESASPELGLPHPQGDNIWMRVVADWCPSEVDED